MFKCCENSKENSPISIELRRKMFKEKKEQERKIKDLKRGQTKSQLPWVSEEMCFLTFGEHLCPVQ